MRRRIAIVLLLGGSAAIVWCVTVLGSAALYQWYEGWRITRVEQQHPLPVVVERKKPPKLHQVIGRLEIPQLHLSTIVMEGDDADVLRLGAGHVPGTALPYEPGNVGIAAHRDTFFRPLKSIQPNDRITLTTPDGKFDYVVESTEIVRPSAVNVLDATTHPELTLVTCYPFYYIGSAPMRFVVHARLTGPQAIAAQESAAARPAGQNGF
jgi:sortase A